MEAQKPSGSDIDPDLPADLIKLTEVTRPAILETLRARFVEDLIYTSIGPILVSVNPFKWIAGIYGEALMQQYVDGTMNLSDNPHVFAIANDAYADLAETAKNQSLIIRFVVKPLLIYSR